MKRQLKVVVFCSARPVQDPRILAHAQELTSGLAARGWQLLYGGSSQGLMGYFAGQMLQAGGIVRAATTEHLSSGREGVHQGLHEVVVTRDLFDRKKWFIDEGDAFVIFPGGFGTLDEALEVITWKSLGYHEKPILFVNVNGFWQHQLRVFADFQNQGLIAADGLGLFQVCHSTDEVWAVLDHEAEFAI